jgi:hypothetical protein
MGNVGKIVGTNPAHKMAEFTSPRWHGERPQGDKVGESAMPRERLKDLSGYLEAEILAICLGRPQRAVCTTRWCRLQATGDKSLTSLLLLKFERRKQRVGT